VNDFISPEFIEGFIEESDEHLQAISNHLLGLEGHLRGEAVDDSAVIRDLLRSFHTLKGLAGMVELGPAADLSHALESVLHRLMRERKPVTGPVLDVLFAGVRTLTDIIATMRDPSRKMPRIQSLIKRLERLAPSETPPRGEKQGEDGGGDRLVPAPPSLSGATRLPEALLRALTGSDLEGLEAARAGGDSLYVAVFIPSSDLNEKGVTVNRVREHLSSTHRIVKAIPLLEGTSVRFGFVLSGQGAPSPLDGLEITPFTAGGTEVAVAEEAVDELPHPEQPWAVRGRTQSATVRVEIGRLDEVMRLVGDLVVSRARLSDLVDRIADDVLRDALVERTHRIERQLRSLRDAVVRARMVPLAQVFGRMPLAVRDLSRQSGREVQLVLEGEETQVDKLLVESLHDPLLHLVRNAIVHGIEAPGERREAAKAVPATLAVRGRPEGDSIVIEVEDDGRGIDLERVSTKARGRGLIGPDEQVTAATLLDIITRPGFSTREEADIGAGRGMGMDVVARGVRSVGGSLSVQSRPGQGTAFIIRLPLTLAIIDAFIVCLGEERYAVPTSAVDRVVEVDPAEIVRMPSGEMLPWRGSALSLVRLGRIFGRGDPVATPGIGLVHGPRAVVVDRVVGLREVVVTPISDPLIAQEGITGATELGDGAVALILDLSALLRRETREANR
jgi:two-component system chemotaxis sensor kinase CheA